MDYRNVTNTSTNYVEELVVRTFYSLPVTNMTEIDVPKEVEKYNSYLVLSNYKKWFYKSCKTTDWKNIRYIYLFWLVSVKKQRHDSKYAYYNDKLDMLVKSSNLVYFNTVNNKNDFRNTIWFEIVNNIEFNTETNGIACLPNMSVVPKNKSGLILDSYMVVSEDGASADISQKKKDILRLWIEGVYIPVAYIVSGIIASYQCPEFLHSRFKNVTQDYPGVQFDIEASNYALKVPISGYTNNIKNNINNRNFGFVFSSDNNQVEGKDLAQIIVYKARSMQSINNEYESLYKTLVATYITRMIRAQTSDYKQDNVTFFFSANYGDSFIYIN